MKGWNIFVDNVLIKQQEKTVYISTKFQVMEEQIIPVVNVSIKQR